MSRLTWEDLPEPVRDRVQAGTGQVVKTEPAARSGLMPGLTARLHLLDGSSRFLKAIRSSHEAVRLNWAEEWVNRVLPATMPSPALLWHSNGDGWHLMVFEYVNDHARHADLSPGSPDLHAVLDTLALMQGLLTPCPRGALPIARNLAPLHRKARHLLDSEQVNDLDLYLAAIGRFCDDDLDGDTLIHYDLNPGNLLVSRGRVNVLDWSFGCRGAAWVESALFAPRLVQAGHTPAGVDELLTTIPGWSEAPRDAVAGLAALWTLFRTYKALHGPQEHRPARAAAASAGHAWLLHVAAR
ncbi:phosphotransferase [Nonomuraea sp. NPDC023979]|uniref:phosphotransferase n=1 Tax=Nonomuraea sp. NPDC023979 TaxID=3154796 RepID=UPI0033C60214